MKRSQDEVYEDLLAAAARLFRRDGFAGTSVRAIAAEMEMEGGSLYYHMSKKTDLLYAISIRSLDEVGSALVAINESQMGPLERVRAVMETHAELVLGKVNEHAAMLFELRSLPEAQRAEVIELRDRNESLMQNSIAVARDAGAFRLDHTLRFQTLTMLNLLNWPLIWYRPDGAMTPAQIGRQLADVYLDGQTQSQS